MSLGLLSMVALTSFNVSVLPLHLLPMDGAGIFIHASVCTIALIVELSRRRSVSRVIIHPFVISFAVLVSLLCSYLVISPEKEYGLEKLALFGLKAVLPVCVLVAYAPFDKSAIRAVLISCILGTLFASIAILTTTPLSALGSASRLSVSEDLSPIGASRSLGYGIVVLSSVLIHGHLSARKSIVTLLLLLIGILGLLATGTRGPLIGVAVAVVGATLVVPGKRLNKLRRLSALVAVALLVWIALYKYGYANHLEKIGGYLRIKTYLETPGENPSDVARLVRYDVAYDIFIKSAGVGVGTGGYAFYYGYKDREYPHNLFLEVLVEQGIPGFIILIIMLSLLAKTIVSYRRWNSLEIEIWILVGLLIFTLFNSMISGDIADNGVVWVSALLLIGHASSHKMGRPLNIGDPLSEGYSYAAIQNNGDW